MKIGIIGAVELEVAPFLDMMGNYAVTERALLRFCEGHIAGVPVVVVFCGVGKVNAALATTLLIETFACEAIINAGTSGGMDARLRIFDTVVSTEVAHHDVDASILRDYHPYRESIYFPAGEGLLALARQAAETVTDRQVLFGRMMTGEAFIDDSNRAPILEKYAPMSVDMETAAVAQVCAAFGLPYISVRSITDDAEHSGLGTFEENCAIAAQRSGDFVRAMLERM